MRFLITAGPTREPIDPVRYLSNRSSGKMGYAIAEAAVAAGHATTLISGPVALAAPAGLERFLRVETAAQMLTAVHAEVVGTELLVMCAAVADFRPARPEEHKIKKGGRGALTLELIPTEDILGSLLSYPWKGSKRPVRVAFAAETRGLAEAAETKLREKGCDLIVGNDVGKPGIGFESDHNELLLCFRSGERRTLPLDTKRQLATMLVGIFANLVKN